MKIEWCDGRFIVEYNYGVAKRKGIFDNVYQLAEFIINHYSKCK